jgi:hypothetical protein
MKTKVLYILIFILSGAGLKASANIKHHRETVPENAFNILMLQLQHSQTVRVAFEKPVNKSLKVVLKNPEGDEILSFFVDMKTKLVYRNFNFTNAEMGIYKLEISDRNTKIVKNIKIDRIKLEELTELTLD